MRRAIAVLGVLAVAACGGPGAGTADDASTQAPDAALAEPPDGSTPTDAAEPGDAGALDAGGPSDASAADVDAGAPDGGSAACAPGVTGCTCVDLPADSANACRHGFGGLYANHGCSGAYQCCDGAWRAGQGACGACACVEATGSQGCVPAGEAVVDCFEAFAGAAEPLPAGLQQSMTGVSWRAGCPLGLDQLSLLTMTHWGFDGAVRPGVMVVASGSADEVLEAFQRMYDARFPIERMALVDDYGADDDLSMADNNTSAFNCRPMTGGTAWSRHSYGTAIDVNPIQNPYVWGGLVLPPEGSAYLDREDARPGMLVDPGPAVGAFRSVGWFWGGDWSAPKDYQHFSADGS